MELIKGQPLDDWLEMRYDERNGVSFTESKPLESDDEDLIASIDDGGLGFKRLQLKALKAKVEEVK